MENIIETIGLKKAFPVVGGDDFYALKDINIVVPKGKLTIFKGRSGSGKTTLMNMLGALDQGSEGSVLFDGIELGGLREKSLGKLRRENMGFVFQSVALIPIMNAYENVEFALRLANYKGDMGARVKECLELVGLGSRMKHMPQEMSGGEQQRVAIARAIAHNPKVIFADEPTAELDTITGLQIIKIFKELCSEKEITVVMVTHDTDLMEAGDVLFEIRDGEIVYE